MQNGWNSRIDITASDDTPRTVWLAETDVQHLNVPMLEKCSDAEWHVYTPSNDTTSQNEWILIRATDDSIRKVRTKCQYWHATGQPGDFESYIYTHFVFANPDGSDEHEDKQLYFIAPEGGRHFKVTVERITHPPGAPKFFVEDL